MAREYTGPAWPEHKLGGIYAIMDRHGMLPDGPDGFGCVRCAKPLNMDGNHLAELYAGTFNGLCYGCTSAPPYVARIAVLDGAREVSWPPNCPSYRRDRQKHLAYEGCGNCAGMGLTLVNGHTSRSMNNAGHYCEPCMTRYTAHPVRKAADKWLTQCMRSCDAVFQLAVDQAAGVPRKCTKKRRAELREAFAGPDRDHKTPEFAALAAIYLAGYHRIRGRISDHLAARGYNEWTSTADTEQWARAYCKWRGLDYDAMKAAEEAGGA